MKAINNIAGSRDADKGFPPRSDGNENYIDGYCYRIIEIHDKIHKSKISEAENDTNKS